MISLSDKQKEAVVETLKDVARVALMAVVSWGIAKLSTLPETETTIISLAFLNLIDSGLHEWGKVAKNDVLIKGITRF